MKKIHAILWLSICTAMPYALPASAACSIATALPEDNDTTARHLDELVVTAKVEKEILPVQTLSGDELQRLSSNSVADALRYFSGVQVKDYGGVGGIKTVNVRSMGTNHTGVVYDGVQLGNAQNGQIDLGQFSLDNIEAISLHNGQKSDILQPARDFGSAATVYMRTRRPDFDEGKNFNARFNLRTGSFHLLNPSAIIELRLSQKVNCSLAAEWLNSSGKYKFRYRRVNPAGEIAYDTTAVRQNGDINATRLELNFFGDMPCGEWRAKVYNYNAERGVPGAIVNNVWRRGERIWDTNSFAQASASMSFGRFSTMENLKYAFYRTHYVNNDDTQLHIDNLYRQREIYFSSANMYEITPRISTSLSYDFSFNNLLADVYGFVKPVRFSNMLAIAASGDFGRIQTMASCLYTNIHDSLEDHDSPDDKNVFTPAAYLNIFPLRDRSLSLRIFYKRSFRMPTFNDLYYADMGNSSLNPETVNQYNAGILYEIHPRGLLSTLRLSADAYYNYVTDKIVAYPKGQQFRWTMLNLGIVDIRGIDATLLATFSPLSDLDITLRGQYTFQRAIDITSPSDNYYRHQIPYIPRHSGSAVVNLVWRQLSVNYSWIYVGERYNQQENILYNYTQPWYTSDLSFSYFHDIKATRLRATLEINNLLGQDYDVIINYPMPKTNWRLTLSCEI